tara:strand:- start:988 stop:1170 length:183 start_codon:yes stop_codon:yes gene_type:complete
MFDKYIYNTLHFIMKYAGKLNSWAWHEHVTMIRRKQEEEHERIIRNKENSDYLEELKRKL